VAQRLLDDRALSRMQDLMTSEIRGTGPVSVRGGWLVDEVLFRLLVDFEIQKAQRLRYSLSIVCFAVEPSAPVAGEVSTSVAEGISRYLRGTDAVASWTQGWLSFLFVDAETRHLPSILRRLTAQLERVVWSAGGSSYPKTATRAEDMLRQAIDLMDKAKDEGGNRLYVAS
jgi:hypothetical protein